jgi:hypothetical protein
LYEKLPQAVVVGGITLGGKDEGAFGCLLACLAATLPSLSNTNIFVQHISKKHICPHISKKHICPTFFQIAYLSNIFPKKQ